MPFHISCPHCSRQLKVPDEARGKKLRCPGCQKAFQCPEEEAPASYPVAEPEPPRPASRSRSKRVQGSGRDYADAAGFDLDEYHNESVPDAAFAGRLLEDWKQTFPEVPSAYQPSGKLPAAALIWMSLGAGIGTPAGLLAGALVGVVAGVVVAIIGGVIALLEAFCGVVVCITVVLFALAILVGLGLMFIAQGYVSAYCTVALGRFGKNRNAMAAAVLSIASALLGLIIIAVPLTVIGPGMIAEWIGELAFGIVPNPDAAAAHQPSSLAVAIGWGTLILSALVAVVVAGVAGAQMVADAKFCEDCEQYMQEKELVDLGLGGVKTLAKALGEKKVPIAVDLMNAPAGTNGKTKLFHCQGCGKGFLELTATFKATWQEKDDNKDKTESWLAGSVDLTSDQVDQFKPHIRKS